MSDDVIRVSELSYAYTDDFPILSGLDVQVPRGSFYGLLGRNGTGKTTLIRILLGMLRPAAGGCEILGLDPRTQAMEIRGRVGYVPQENDFDPQMTIGQTLDFIRSFYRGRWSDETVKTYMQRFELSHRKGERIEQLSGGLKQRLALVVALAFDPEMIILDEPTAGLDAVVLREFMETMIDYMAEEGRTVVLSSHLLHEVDRLADRVGILADGKMLVDTSLEDLKTRVTRLSCELDSEEPPDVPGLIRWRSIGQRWHLAAWTDSETQERDLMAQLEATGAREVAVLESSLESVFVDLVSEKETEVDETREPSPTDPSSTDDVSGADHVAA